MKKDDLSLFSIFPEQIMKSFGEWLTVPLMNRILVGNLPLILVRKSKLVDFAAANGQFMMFKAETYKQHWFHEWFKDERVEDIRIIRMMKALEYPVHTLLSGGQVSCRMYHGYREGLTGFSKNIHAFFGKNWLILFLYNLLSTLGLFSVWISFSFKAMLIYLAALFIFSFLVSVQSRQSIWKNILLMPFQHFSVVLISLLAAYRQMTGGLYWKGRRI
jgi:chlorobactene glucosyltransferase